MLNFERIIQSEYESEYKSEYDLPLKQQFSEPKIYTANGDITKRWYIYYSYRDPKTNRLKRQAPVYASANKYKTKEERLAILVPYRQILLKLLKKGYSPYEDNTEKYLGSKTKTKVQEVMVLKPQTPKPPQKRVEKVEKDNGISVVEAIEQNLTFKQKTLRSSSLRSYSNHLDIFEKWLKKKKVKYINRVDKKWVSEFLNDILLKSSARNFNNYRATLSSFFQWLMDQDIITENFVLKIKKLKAPPKRNKTYSPQQHDKIFEYLEKEDPILLLFIKFVSYNFLRPIEVCRLKVGDIDIHNKRLTFKAKNSPRKTKIIPEILFKELPDLSKLDKEALLFTPKGFGEEWNSTLENRRGAFTERFKKVVKDKFNLDKDHTMYSFRHTFITKLYRNLVKDMPPFQAKSSLMLITGHSSMTALESYLRDIDAELPDDYSNLLKD